MRLLLVSFAAILCACSGTRSRVAVPSQPRVPPVAAGSETPEQKRLLDGLDPASARLNVVRTWAVNPKLAAAWLPLGTYILRNSTLPPRDREILILRIGWLNRSVYEFTQHVRVGKAAGLTDAEIRQIQAGPGDSRWTDFDRALLRAADQLHRQASIDDAVWTVLKSRYNQNQLMDVVVTVGQYNLVSWYLNTIGVPLEAGVAPHPMK